MGDASEFFKDITVDVEALVEKFTTQRCIALGLGLGLGLGSID